MFTRAMRFIRRGDGRHPVLIDTLLGGILAAPAVLVAMTPHPPTGPVSTGSVGAALFAWAAVACRRLWPIPVLLITDLATVALTLRSGSQQPALMIALVVVVYTVASRLDRRRTWAMAVAVALPLYLATVLTSASDWWAPQNIGSLAWIGMAAAVGDATRTRLAYVAEVEERARRAEQNRDQEARRRVVEERIRIARELHDVVSHHIAVINVQAGAARHVLRHQPQAADSALEHIRRASDTVLRELGSIVGVLRQPDEPDDPDEPTRGLARIVKLLDAAGAAGLKVEHHQNGEARQLPAVVDLAAYRILQEALTNAHKHGTGTACLTIEYTPGHVLLEVTNRIGAPGPTSGYGLVGMRERASAAGGTLTAERCPDGRFRVRAVLPAPTPKEQS
ncbi:signal transduction histidine kinase [Actinoplanes octamycinicus]|uniref:histidine kinase n=2 Tax=Actinoplanes octamycinicus TaxID=135948 RepID=A0A7W7MB98_9ACTN|nr:histidine kinase [Actinoplanes octamycinicus]MBB4743898.1 signal transduction histidine kinase [Actinoplanes octamycinicus]